MYILDTDHLSVLDRGGINAIPIIDFDIDAANEFQRIRKLYPRLGTMDLKIAAIAIVNNAIVLTRNTSDFGQIANLQIEDWTQ
jgi:tRNA(fMet)-specific endonuclease VapC